MAKKRNRKMVVLTILAVTVLLVAAVYIGINQMIRSMQIPTIALAEVENGIYIGSHALGPMNARVEVTVEDHVITSIVLQKHLYGFGKQGEEVIDYVMQKQSLDVDTVASATGSSKVILNAIANALWEGIK